MILSDAMCFQGMRKIRHEIRVQECLLPDMVLSKNLQQEWLRVRWHVIYMIKWGINKDVFLIEQGAPYETAHHQVSLLLN